MVTPLGLDTPSSWDALLAGRSGLGPITHFDPEGFDVRVVAEVKGFVPEDHLDRRTARRGGRHTQMGVVAGLEAVASANLAVDDANRDAIGVIIASSGAFLTIGEQELVIETRGPSRVESTAPAPPAATPSARRSTSCASARPSA
jgi:3-oxoacyl-[acyl-carrier-protein] synthase II